jgi:hypothetical protein
MSSAGEGQHASSQLGTASTNARAMNELCLVVSGVERSRFVGSLRANTKGLRLVEGLVMGASTSLRLACVIKQELWSED